MTPTKQQFPEIPFLLLLVAVTAVALAVWGCDPAPDIEAEPESALGTSTGDESAAYCILECDDSCHHGCTNSCTTTRGGTPGACSVQCTETCSIWCASECDVDLTPARQCSNTCVDACARPTCTTGDIAIETRNACWAGCGVTCAAECGGTP